jgi:hypothetical protein
MGARIRVHDSAGTYKLEVNDGVNYRTQSDISTIVIGLGSEAGADIRVKWPDGTRDCLSSAADVTLTIEMASSPC